VEGEALARLRAAKPGRALYTNVEFYAAVVLERAGIPRELFTPTFSISRAIGWTAHILEQVRDNRLIRPSADYVGPRDRTLGS
jgi:citrate synthase